MERELTILLVEDDPRACQDMISYIETQEDMLLVGVVNNTTKAMKLICDCLPDAMILDLELQKGGGNGLTLMRELNDSYIGKKPYVLVTTNNSSTITYEAAHQLGADFIFSKHQSDYSAKMVVDFLRTIKNVIQRSAAASAPETPQEAPAIRQKRMIRRISTELDSIGISPKVKGYSYLVDAIYMVIQRPTQNICDALSLQYQKTASSIERAMQNAIARAWCRTPIEELTAGYTARINPEKGVPTLTEFIYFYANKIRNEK